MAKQKKGEKAAAAGIREQLRVPAGPVDLTAYDTRATPGFDGSKDDGKVALEGLGAEVSDWQERLFAEGRKGGERSVLLVLQGMDTSGKGGVLRHTVGLVDPQGVQITGFTAPSEDERRHDFLWRVQKVLPRYGHIGVFDRSHYEDVLIGRVRELAPAREIERRYEAINAFERELVGGGTTVLKCMLHISPEEQRRRLLARLDNPQKYWKYNPGDVDERRLWADYRQAYEIALQRTNTEVAPWHVVPSDRKWFRNLTVARLLLETLRRMDPQWPGPHFDVEQERKRLTDLDPLS